LGVADSYFKVLAHTATIKANPTSFPPSEPPKTRSLLQNLTKNTLALLVSPSSPRLLLFWRMVLAPVLSTVSSSHNRFPAQELSESVVHSSNASTQVQRRSIFQRHHGPTMLLSSRTQVWKLRSTDTTTRTQLVWTSRA
jgi:hypothetical protein